MCWEVQSDPLMSLWKLEGNDTPPLNELRYRTAHTYGANRIQKWHQEQIDLLTHSTRQPYHVFGAKPTQDCPILDLTLLFSIYPVPKNDTHTSGRAYLDWGTYAKQDYTRMCNLRV